MDIRVKGDMDGVAAAKELEEDARYVENHEG